METAISNQVMLENTRALQEKIIRMLQADNSKHIRVRHGADNVVEITELGPGETRDTDTEELSPVSVSSESTFDAKRRRLQLKLQMRRIAAASNAPR